MAGEEHLIAGRYRLLGRIASGGMGDVWRAVDTRIDRIVAVKLLHAALSVDERFRTRFEAEARLVASINSPSVAALHDYGAEEGPHGFRAYLVMEFVDGEPLRDVIDRGPLSAAETMRIIDGAAAGLAAAHAAGIVHRDVKPENILVTDTDAVKLIDFGIARANGSAGLTEVGKIMGTIAYSSPEQIAGDELTPSTDVYSLAVVAYEALTGRTPFVSESIQAVMNGHLNRPVPPLPSSVPLDVAAVVMTGLDKDVERRWSSVEEFGRACRAACTDAVPPAVSPSDETPPIPMSSMDDNTSVVPDARVTRPMHRGRRRLMAAALIVLLVVLAVVGGIVGRAGTPGVDAAAPPGGRLGPEAPVGREGPEPSGDDPVPVSSRDDETPDAEPDAVEGIAVLDVLGESTKDVIRLLREAGFDNVTPVERPWTLHLGPSCVVTEQSPEPGAVVDPSTTITVHFASLLPNACPVEESSEESGEEPIEESSSTPHRTVSRSADRTAAPRNGTARRGR